MLDACCTLTVGCLALLRLSRRSYSALAPLAGATAAVLVAACTQLPFGVRAPEPEPVRIVVPAPPAWKAPAPAAASASDDDGVERLVQFGDVWQTVRWFHPEVVSRATAWDTAYLRHVDAARDASTADQFVAAVHALLGELDDPATRVVAAAAAPSADAASGLRELTRASVVWQTADSVVLARPVAFATVREFALQQRRLPGSLRSAMPPTAAVLDLRADSGGSGNNAWWTRAPVAGELPVRGTLEAPARRRVRRLGPPAVAEGAAAACCTQWTVTTGPSFSTMDAESELPGTVVVLVNDATIVPSALFTLHAEGRVVFVSAESGVLQSDAAAVFIPLRGGVRARVRTEELLLADGRAVPTHADTIVAATRSPDALVADTSDLAVQAALTIARDRMRDGPLPVGARVGGSRLTIADAAVRLPDSAPVELYPSLPERLLAVTTLWSAVRAFDPYVPVADESWDEKFRRALQEAETASTSRTYATALTRFVSVLDASQVSIDVPDHPEFGRRPGAVPFRLRLVERRAIVTAMQDTAAERSGVQVGDEIVAIGGEPIENRLGRLRELISASNSWSREQRLERWLASGPALVKATFRVRRGTADARDVEFSYSEQSAMSDSGMVARQIDSLSSGVVRIRADDAVGAWRDSITRAPIVPLPEMVTAAQALIVDLRGVRSDVALRWLAGSVLEAEVTPYVRDAHIELTAPPRGGLRTPELDVARQVTWTERVTTPSASDAFAGPMAILIDATTIGDGELLALRLAAGGANRVLVGTSTAGAVGQVAVLPLAGGVRVDFPTSDTRRPDGRLIQRLGVPPDVMASPTVAGVRAGRDEVLEAAQRWISRQLAPPSPARRR